MTIQLTDEQISQLIEAFYNFDSNGDDYLSVNELENLLASVGMETGSDSLKDILADLRINTRAISKKDLLSVSIIYFGYL